MGYIDVNSVSLTLADGRPLLDEVSFRVGEGSVSALIGANGAGKSTLLKIIRGEVRPDSGAITVDGGLGVMDQFVGHLATTRPCATCSSRSHVPLCARLFAPSMLRKSR